MDNFFTRIAVVLLLGFLGLKAYQEWRKPDMETAREAKRMELLTKGELEPGQLVTDEMLRGIKTQNGAVLLTLCVITAALTGFVALKWILPFVGDRLSGAINAPSPTGPMEPSAKAMSLIVKGEFPEAIAELRKLAEQNPTDRFPIVEIAKVQCDRMEDPDAAIATLEDALSKEWSDEDTAFFMTKLADLHLTEKQDSARAKELLSDIIQRFPGSSFAGNATHKLREIEEAEFLASRGEQ